MSIYKKRAIIFLADYVSAYAKVDLCRSYQEVLFWGAKCDFAKIGSDIIERGIDKVGIISQVNKNKQQDFIAALTEIGIAVLCIQDKRLLLKNSFSRLGYQKGLFLDWEAGFFHLYDLSSQTCELKNSWLAALSEFSDYISRSFSELKAGEQLFLSESLKVLFDSLISFDKPLQPVSAMTENASTLLCRELDLLPEYKYSAFSLLPVSKLASVGLMLILMVFLSGFFSPSSSLQKEMPVTSGIRQLKSNALPKEATFQNNAFTQEKNGQKKSTGILYYGLMEGNSNCGLFAYCGQEIQICNGFAARNLQMLGLAANEAILWVSGERLTLWKQSKNLDNMEALVSDLADNTNDGGDDFLVPSFMADGYSYIKVLKDIPSWQLQAGDKIDSFAGYRISRPSDLHLFNKLAENSFPLAGFSLL